MQQKLVGSTFADMSFKKDTVKALQHYNSMLHNVTLAQCHHSSVQLPFQPLAGMIFYIRAD